jgi:hypothetical protein
MSEQPQQGDVWERDGRRRVVDRVVGETKIGFDVWWNGRTYPTWCTTWRAWASKAKLIERNGKAVEA